MLVAQSDSFRPHGLQPTRPLCPWDSPGKNTRVGYHSLLQGIFLTQGWNPGLPQCRPILYHLSHQAELTFHSPTHPHLWTCRPFLFRTLPYVFNKCDMLRTVHILTQITYKGNRKETEDKGQNEPNWRSVILNDSNNYSNVHCHCYHADKWHLGTYTL